MSGNVFKDNNGNSITTRIKKENVDVTIQYLENLTGIENLHKNKLGSTGLYKTSGDIDLAVDHHIPKKLLYNLLCLLSNPNSVKISGINVHYLSHIINQEGEYVQVDFMFGEPNWLKFAYAGSPREGSLFKGRHRAILLASIAKAKGMKWSPSNGLKDRKTDELLSDDPYTVAEMLFDDSIFPDQLLSVESINRIISPLKDYNELVSDAVDTFKSEGLILQQERDD